MKATTERPYTVTLIHKNGTAAVEYTYETEQFARDMGFDWFKLVGVKGPIVAMAMHHMGNPAPLAFHTF